MNRPTFTNEEKQLKKQKLPADNRIHFPANAFHTLLKFDGTFYRIAQFNHHSGDEAGIIVIEIRADGVAEVLPALTDSTLIDLNKTYVYLGLEYEAQSLQAFKQYNNIYFGLIHKPIAELASSAK